MVRTRVGYAGGTTPSPTYASIGDHTETLQLDFDPAVIGYGQLLEVFFASHNACARPWSRQYMSAVFCHDAAQLAAARAAAAEVAAQRGEVRTRIETAGLFYLAEDYHQKYTLRRHRDLAGELTAIYPELRDFVDSTAATRLNGYLAGHGEPAQIRADLPRLGLSATARDKAAALCGVGR